VGQIVKWAGISPPALPLQEVLETTASVSDRTAGEENVGDSHSTYCFNDLALHCGTAGNEKAE